MVFSKATLPIIIIMLSRLGSIPILSHSRAPPCPAALPSLVQIGAGLGAPAPPF